MRTRPPTGAEIAAAATKGRLEKRKSVTGHKNGKRVHFTGAAFDSMESIEDLETGQFVGVLETEAAGDESGLPPGTYNLHLARVEGKWRLFAEADGEVAGEAVRVEVERHPWGEHKAGPPRFREEGWCLVDICLISFWGFCLVGIRFGCF